MISCVYVSPANQFETSPATMLTAINISPARALTYQAAMAMGMR
jgi:hypothetical protein